MPKLRHVTGSNGSKPFLNRSRPPVLTKLPLHKDSIGPCFGPKCEPGPTTEQVHGSAHPHDGVEIQMVERLKRKRKKKKRGNSGTLVKPHLLDQQKFDLVSDRTRIGRERVKVKGGSPWASLGSKLATMKSPPPSRITMCGSIGRNSTTHRDEGAKIGSSKVEYGSAKLILHFSSSLARFHRMQFLSSEYTNEVTLISSKILVIREHLLIYRSLISIPSLQAHCKIRSLNNFMYIK